MRRSLYVTINVLVVMRVCFLVAFSWKITATKQGKFLETNKDGLHLDFKTRWRVIVIRFGALFIGGTNDTAFSVF